MTSCALHVVHGSSNPVLVVLECLFQEPVRKNPMATCGHWILLINTQLRATEQPTTNLIRNFAVHLRETCRSPEPCSGVEKRTQVICSRMAEVTDLHRLVRVAETSAASAEDSSQCADSKKCVECLMAMQDVKVTTEVRNSTVFSARIHRMLPVPTALQTATVAGRDWIRPASAQATQACADRHRHCRCQRCFRVEAGLHQSTVERAAACEAQCRRLGLKGLCTCSSRQRSRAPRCL